MPRKAIAIVQYKLRIREALRRRIERAAKQHGISANQEMASRLERSFEQEATQKLDLIVAELGNLLKDARFVAAPGPYVYAAGPNVFKDSASARWRISAAHREERQAFTANQTSILMPAFAWDAQNITLHVLGLLKDEDLNHLNNRKFVRAFIRKLPATERDRLSSKDGGLSPEGLARVRNAIFYKAYGQPKTFARITESTDEDVKSIYNALEATAPAWAKLRAEIEAGHIPERLDVTDQLVESVKCMVDMRSNGQTIDGYLAQHLEGFHIAGHEDRTKLIVYAWLRNFEDSTSKRAMSAQWITEFLRVYIHEATKADPDGDNDQVFLITKAREEIARRIKMETVNEGPHQKAG